MTPSKLIIRRFRNDDRDAVIQLWRDCGLVVPWNDPNKDIDRKLARDPDLFFVGEERGRVVASAMGGYEGHRGWVNYLAVHPNQQRNRYGEQIMHHLERELLALGCPKINLQIRSSNTQVIEFYAAIGYKTDDVVSMGKRLIPDGPKPTDKAT